eukprot:1421826-Karenia_brevis.AAC.1
MEKLSQSKGQAVQDSVNKRVSRWEACPLRVSNSADQLELIRFEIQRRFDGLTQGFLSQLLGILRDSVDALLKPEMISEWSCGIGDELIPSSLPKHPSRVARCQRCQR